MLNLLLLAALLVAALRLRAFWAEPLPALPVAAHPPTTVAKTSPAASSPSVTPGSEQAEGYPTIVGRDLFSPARGVVPPATTPSAVPVLPARPPTPPKLTLFGVVMLDAEKAAYLTEGAQESRPRKVREGEAFAGGKVTAIRPDGVTFLFAGTEIGVPLRVPKEGLATLPNQPLPNQQPLNSLAPPTVPVPSQPPPIPARFQQGGRMVPAPAVRPGLPARPAVSGVPRVPTFVPPGGLVGADASRQQIEGAEEPVFEGDQTPFVEEEQQGAE